MTKTLIGVLAALLLAACSTTPKQEGGAPVDERNPERDHAGRGDLGRDVGIGRRDGQPGRRSGQSAQGSGQHPVQAQRLFRFRRVRDQGRLQVAARGACEVSAGQSQRAHDGRGQYRRARQPRIQHRAGSASRRRRQADDDAVRCDRSADRHGQLRQGKAEESRATTNRRGPRTGATISPIAATKCPATASSGTARARGVSRCGRRSRRSPSCCSPRNSRRRRAARCSMTTRRVGASTSSRTRVDQIERTLAQRLDALEAKNAGLADLFRDVEQIKSDIAKLRGQYEVLTYELEQAQKRQRDLYLDLDSRVRRLEGGPGAPGTPAARGTAGLGRCAAAPPRRAAGCVGAGGRSRGRAEELRRRARIIQERQFRRRGRELPVVHPRLSEKPARAVGDVLGRQCAVRAARIPRRDRDAAAADRDLSRQPEASRRAAQHRELPGRAGRCAGGQAHARGSRREVSDLGSGDQGAAALVGAVSASTPDAARSAAAVDDALRDRR